MSLWRRAPVQFLLGTHYLPTTAIQVESSLLKGTPGPRQGCTGNVLLPPSVGGIPVGGDPHCHNQLQYVSNGPGPPLLEVLAGSNFEDAGWISVLQIGNEACGQALAPCVVGAQCQSSGNIGQFVTGISGMCTPHPGACQCGVGNPAGFRCSAGFAGPGCLGNPGCASRPVVIVEGHCANSGGVLPENVRVCGSNMPHPMGSAWRVMPWLIGVQVTASIQSGTPTHALRPSTISGLARFGGALHRSTSVPIGRGPLSLK